MNAVGIGVCTVMVDTFAWHTDMQCSIMQKRVGQNVFLVGRFPFRCSLKRIQTVWLRFVNHLLNYYLLTYLLYLDHAFNRYMLEINWAKTQLQAFDYSTSPLSVVSVYSAMTLKLS